jgi:exopolysaccharide biosynthesis polyprenyl glycosylphosphotransferase
MLRRFGPVALAFQFLGDLVLTVLAVVLADQIRLHVHTSFEVREQFVSVQPWVYLLVLALWVIFFVLFDVFDPERRGSIVSDLGTLWLSITVSTLVLASFFYMLGLSVQDTPSRLFYLYFYVLDVILLSLAHVIVFQSFALLRRRGRHMRRILLIGTGVQGRHVAVRLRGRESAGVTLIGYLSKTDEPMVQGLQRLGELEEMMAVVREHRIDEVVMALPAEAHIEALKMTSDLQETDVNVRILPDVFEMVAMKARVEDFYGLPLISIREPSINPVQARVKRAFDMVLSTLLLIVLSPFMLIITALIKQGSKGPVLIHQKRIGAGGRPFYMHKFRSMRWNPDDLDKGFAKQPHDPRVTKIGRILRRASLDELPQLWNVLRGEMSLVGPRPELPAVVESYEPWQLKRFAVPPGMTGWWQVNGRADHSMHLNTEIDLFYVQNYSILLDVQILLRTLGAVIKGRGAY